jgi:hypothetical protein
MPKEKKLEQIRRINKKYLNEVEKFEAEFGGIEKRDSHFRQITRDLLNVMWQHDDPEFFSWNKERRKNYLTRLVNLKVYLRLIRQFPDFREVEMSDGYRAFFPEGGDPNPEKYVSYARSKLGENQNAD